MLKPTSIELKTLFIEDWAIQEDGKDTVIFRGKLQPSEQMMRYLKDLLKTYKHSISARIKSDVITIQAYSGADDRSELVEINNRMFWAKLHQLGAIDLVGFAYADKDKDKELFKTIRSELTSTNFEYQENIKVVLKNVALIKQVYDFFSSCLSGAIKAGSKTYFDTETGELFVKGEAIKVRKFKDEYHTLNIIFSEPKREWFFSEISEKFEFAKKFPDKKFYNAVYQTDKKIKDKTGISDFFISTRQSVHINPQYLS